MSKNYLQKPMISTYLKIVCMIGLLNVTSKVCEASSSNAVAWFSDQTFEVGVKSQQSLNQHTLIWEDPIFQAKNEMKTQKARVEAYRKNDCGFRHEECSAKNIIDQSDTAVHRGLQALEVVEKNYNDCVESALKTQEQLRNIIAQGEEYIQKLQSDLSDCQSGKGKPQPEPEKCSSDLSNCQSELSNTLDKKNLFFKSIGYGALYSLVPEILSDGIEYYGGSKKFANILSTITQIGLIAYTTYDYVPFITGAAVRLGGTGVGLSPRVSIILGSMASVIISLAKKDMLFDQEELVNYGIAIAGSYIGNTLTLHTKDWIYSLWKKSPPQLLQERTAQLQQLTEAHQQDQQLLQERAAQLQQLTEEKLMQERKKRINKAMKHSILYTNELYEELYQEMLYNLNLKQSMEIINFKDNPINNL